MNNTGRGEGIEPPRETRSDEPIGDDAITDRLIHDLLTEPHLDQCGVGRHVGPTLFATRPAAHSSWWIELYVENGVITLDGNVPTLAHKNLAGEIAQHVPGARDVVNSISVESTRSPPSW
jgi:hypothetical protein